MAEVMARFVDSKGGKGVPCRSLLAARYAIDENPGAFDCCVIDLLLLDGNGSNLIRELHLTHPRLPTVLCSGLDIDVVSRESLHGVFLSKPFTPEALAAAIIDAMSKADTDRPPRDSEVGDVPEEEPPTDKGLNG